MTKWSPAIKNRIRIGMKWNIFVLNLELIFFHKKCEIVYIPEHSWVLQVSSIVEEPEHSFPPCFAITFSIRVLVLRPPPHLFEHSPICHLSHSQSTGKKF